jgi:drug/metabolite transporter (DMT)-like permease
MRKLAGTYGGVVLSMILWSFSFIWFKIANETYLPLTIVFIRLAISVFLLTAYMLLTGNVTKMKKEDRKLFFLMALCEPFLYFIGESFGLTYVSATAGSVLISTIPVFVILGAWIFFREKLRIINYAGIILSFTGVLIFIINKDGTLSFSIRGILLLSFAVASAVGYNLMLSRLVDSYSPVFIVNVQNTIGALLFLPVFLASDLRQFINTPFSVRSFVPIIELSVFASCGAFILFAYSVRKIGISRANVFTNCVPILTAIFSFILLGDKLTFQNIAGMFIVITGLFMSQINGRREKTDTVLVLTGKTA